MIPMRRSKQWGSAPHPAGDKSPDPIYKVIVLALTLSACTIHHVQPYTPETAAAPETADATAASTNCFEAATAAERLACTDPTVANLNRTLTQTLQSHLRNADIFARDTLLATQRAWLLSLPATCHLPENQTPAPAPSIACLADQMRLQTSALAAWHNPPDRPIGPDAIAQYVHFKPAAGAEQLNQSFCATLAHGANAALASSGTLDPAAIPGATEIAGSHGPPSADAAGHRISVVLRDANAYGGFQQRAQSITLDAGPPALNNLSLGKLLQSTAENNGARFSAYASQTGDYGTADALQYQGRLIGLLADAWGFDTPAAPGEFAHAGAWDLAAAPAAPLCLFETFKMPPSTGAFDTLPSFTPWRDKLIEIRDSAQPPLGVAALRDQGQLRAETNWLLLNMPLLVTQQVRAGGWTNWLRIRHDAVLDALFAWSATSPAHKQDFDRLFALLRPAAQDLVNTYQQTQALTGTEAKQAASVTIMELLYGATINLAPGLGADLNAPSSALGQKPRYPILASPSG